MENRIPFVPATAPGNENCVVSCSMKTCSVDMNGLWRLSDLLIQLQEAAGRHCENLGCGRIPLYRDHGAVWVLTRNEVHIHRSPVLGETVTIETFAGPVRRTLFPRYFILRDADGKTVAEAASFWVLCSAKDRRMIFLPEVAAMVPTPDREPPFTRFSPPVPIQGSGTVLSCHAVYSDLDVNGHVNNTRYADWLCDTLGTAFMGKNRIVSFRIDYHREVLPDLEVRLEVKTDSAAFSMSGFHEDTLLFDISGRYEALPERSPV